MGQGAINLREIIKIVREKKPEARFHLELITRDPLRVPIFNDSYWRTLDGIKAPKLASTLSALKSRPSAKEFPTVSNISPEEQVHAERNNIEQSLRYSAEQLGL